MLLSINGCTTVTLSDNALISEEEYNEIVGHFAEVTVQDIESMQENGEDFLLYTGRSSCEYCRIFVCLLAEHILEEGTKVYYLDSMFPYEDSNAELMSFRDKYEIRFVPHFAYFVGETMERSLEIPSDVMVSDEDIHDFLSQNK
jgi:predicted bacteriocin transport accessory protein